MTPEDLSLERAEELAIELGIDPRAVLRLLEAARRATWYPDERRLEFVFPET